MTEPATYGLEEGVATIRLQGRGRDRAEGGSELSRSVRIAAAAALAALLLAAVGAQADASPPAGASHCTGGGIRAALISFAQSFDRNDGEALESLFAPEPDFQWYSTPRPGRRMNAAAKRRATLGAYFRGRHAAGDHMRLTRFRFNGNGAHWGNFDFTVRRSADDYMDGRRFPQGGKGAAICDAEGVRFIVLTFGLPGRSH